MYDNYALVIDDEKHSYTIISKLIDWRKYNFSIEYAKNGKEGMACLNELNPKIVFVDMNMPVMDGLKFLNLVNLKCIDTKFIIISGFSSFEYAKAGIQYGVCDYLLKPINKKQLEEAVLKYLEEIVLNIEDDIYQVIAEIKEYVENNYAKDIKVSNFANKYFFTKEYISKTYRKVYSIGIYEYVLKLKMERAVELLEQENLLISEIAERLGYNNNNYFSKAFKTYYGVPPSEYQSNLFDN